MDEEPMSDAVNDVGGSGGEPSYVSVAICIGTNMDGKPITLVDRLCINRPAVQQLADDQTICFQQEAAFGREVERLTIQRDDALHRSEVAAWMYGGSVLLMLAICIWIFGRKNV